MSKPKFTPGPWHVESERNVQGQKYYSVSFGDDDGLICEFIAFKEDAHLIAAVPELYEACRFHCETRCKMRNLNKNVCKNCLYGKALRKARGEAEAE